jgi:hypothetical protein
MNKISKIVFQALCLAGMLASPATAQTAGDHEMGAMPDMPAPKDAATVKTDKPGMAGMDMPGMTSDDTDQAMSMPMTGAFGPYAMSREASGTSWQPDSTPHAGLDFMAGDWMLMAHGYADAIYDNQGGRRGDDKAFSASMAMLMGQRPIGEDGTLGLRAMV